MDLFNTQLYILISNCIWCGSEKGKKNRQTKFIFDFFRTKNWPNSARTHINQYFHSPHIPHLTTPKSHTNKPIPTIIEPMADTGDQNFCSPHPIHTHLPKNSATPSQFYVNHSSHLFITWDPNKSNLLGWIRAGDEIYHTKSPPCSNHTPWLQWSIIPVHHIVLGSNLITRHTFIKKLQMAPAQRESKVHLTPTPHLPTLPHQSPSPIQSIRFYRGWSDPTYNVQSRLLYMQLSTDHFENAK